MARVPGAAAPARQVWSGKAGGVVELLTVGHGTLGEEEMAALLREAGIERVVDVRSYPGSRRNPQHGRDRLAEWLPAAGIDYAWEPRLGGRRTPSESSPHVALRHPQFRAYADHMEGEDFRTALGEVLDEAGRTRSAVMCAESVWWRCHRRLLADAVVLLRGGRVLHLFHDGRLEDHAPTDGARVEENRLVYDVGEDLPLPGT